MLDIVYGETKQREVASRLARVLMDMQLDGTFYIGYPVIASADDKILVDALLVSRQHGLVAFRFDGQTPQRDDTEAWKQLADAQDRLFYAIEANLGRHNELRSGRRLGVAVETITLFPIPPEPPQSVEGRFAGIDTVRATITDCAPVDEVFFRPLEAALQRVTTIKPRKKRAAVSKTGSRGAILKEIEQSIANLDQWQKRSAIETPDGPQRIRGLAGSGKTIVLALKAAYLHSQHPDWNIAVTFFTRSLYQQFEDLIRRFSYEHLNDEPNWDRLRILHAWGGRDQDGIYTEIAERANTVPRDFAYGKAKYGHDGAFQGLCQDLLTQTALEPGPPIYDAVLIDEAQDLPPAFFRLVYRFTADPKRIVWAYDELQTLSEAVMPNTSELFGRSDVGEPLVTLHNLDGRPRQDVILPVCYRNTPWALTLAHGLGFGVYRAQGMVQHFDDPQLWEHIGYQVLAGDLRPGNDVTLVRAATSFPEFFERLLRPEDAIMSMSFPDELAQAEWIADGIRTNLTEDELEADDILIVLPSALTARRNAAVISDALARRRIASHLVGVTTSVDEVFRPGSVALANIYRSKGNEAPMVYLANAQTCVAGSELTKKRNILFTAITRCRAWVRICAWGQSSQALIQEIEAVRSKQYQLIFRVPTEAALKDMRRIHRDLTPSEKAAQERDKKQLESLLEKVVSGDLPFEILSPAARAKLQNMTKNAGG